MHYSLADLSFDLSHAPQVFSHFNLFLATYITVQSYPSFDLVQSSQVLFHLHVFPTRIGLNCNTCDQEIHVNGTTLVVIGPNQN
jgi:hypothetical protein